MNKNYKAMLKEEIEERLEAIKKMVPGTEESKSAIDEVCKLIDRANKIEEVENQREIQYKKLIDELYMKDQEIEHDKKKFKVDTGVNIAKFVGGMAFTAGMAACMTVFEKENIASFRVTKEMFSKSLSFFKLS